MLEIAFQLVAPLAESEPSSEYIQGIKGEIRTIESDLSLGMISALLIQVGRVADAGEDLFDVMDGASVELGKYHGAFFKPHNCDYKQAIWDQFADIIPLDLLIVDHVEILPSYQKRGIGLLAVARTIDIFGENCGLVAMRPFPLQFRNYLDPDWRPPDGMQDPVTEFRVATQKLRSHWARAGFKLVRGTDYYALCPARKRPSLRTIAATIPLLWCT